MKKLFLRILLAATVIASSSSCEHKDLCMDHTHTVSLNVIFDWRNAPDAAPASMALYLYSELGGEPLRYDFTDRRGGSCHGIVLEGRIDGHQQWQRDRFPCSHADSCFGNDDG